MKCGDDEGPAHGEEEGQDVADTDPRQQDGGEGPVAAGVEAPYHQTEEDQRQREADREAELPGHRRRDVAPVDVVHVVEEQVGDRRHRQARRPGKPHAGQAAERIGGEGQGDQAQDGHQLEGDVVRDDVREERDPHDRAREVVRQRREALVPVGRPSRQAEVGQQGALDEVR